MNTVNLIGRLTKDPELRYTPSGVAICKFTVAVNRDFTNQNGEREADFINCTAFKKTAENLSNYQTKGSRVGVVGRIQTGSYEGQDGKRVFTTDVMVDRVEFLESKQGPGGSQPNQRVDEDPFASSKGPIEVSEDDLPF
ncbi:MAG TPA: single-stranded DNA-binding protein [Ureibacillus sp.]|nr:single-stranded DNA-binding protein [Ureibacillus sp.]